MGYVHLMTKELSAAVDDDGVWQLRGTAAEKFGLVNEFLGYLADRNFSPRTCRAYAYDLLAFARWLTGEQLGLAEVNVDVLLRFLTACREAALPGRPGGNVYSIRDGRNQGYAPATINRRLAAISSLFAFREMRDPDARSPVGSGRAARLRSRSERSGLLAHTAKPKSRSQLRVREPRRLPRGLSREESAALLGSFRSWRDRAIGGLMLLSGLRSAEVLSLRVADVDIARRWVRVFGKGGKERSVPIDTDVAGAIQTYLLAERPETDADAAVRRRQRRPSRTAADPCGAAHGVPVSPRALRCRGGASTRVTAFVWHRIGRGGGRPVGDPSADGPRPRRFRCRLHPLGPNVSA